MSLQWPLMLFTLFLCIGAGILLFQMIVVLKERDASITVPVTVVAGICVIIGGICSALHLHHADRFFNGFAHISSGITLELIFVALFLIVDLIVLVQAKRHAGKPIGRGLAWTAIVASVALVTVMSLSYLMPARPIWDNVALPLFYLTNMVLFGAFGLDIIARARKAEKVVESTGRYCKIAAIVGLAGYLVYFAAIALMQGEFSSVGTYYDPTNPNTAIMNASDVTSTAFTGAGAPYLWGGLVLGGIAPIACAWLGARKKSLSVAWPVIGFACAIAGGILFRALLYILGFSTFMIS